MLVIALGIFSLPSITVRPVHATDPGWNGSGKVTLDQYSGNAPKVVYVPPGIGSDTEFMFFLSATGTCGTNPQTYTILLITSSNEFQSHSSVDQSPFCAQPFSTGGSLDAAFDPATNLIYLIFVDTTGCLVRPNQRGEIHRRHNMDKPRAGYRRHKRSTYCDHLWRSIHPIFWHVRGISTKWSGSSHHLCAI